MAIDQTGLLALVTAALFIGPIALVWLLSTSAFVSADVGSRCHADISPLEDGSDVIPAGAGSAAMPLSHPLEDPAARSGGR
jgi:hypothetical protein